jgi:pyruvate kinase
MNNTKIIGTIGPSSYDKSVLRKMFAEGLSVVRINFSHSDHEKALQIYQWVEEINEEENRNVATLADLQGPKLRIGNVKEDQTLKKGEKITITTEECIGDISKIYITYPTFPKDVKVGDKIMLDDGKIILEAQNSNKKNEVEAVVIQGGELNSKKGVNLPNTKISLPCLTAKDLADLDFALDTGIEWIGLSFVRSVNDIKKLQKNHF